MIIVDIWVLITITAITIYFYSIKTKWGEEEEILSPVFLLLIIHYIYGLSPNDVSEYLYKIKCKYKKE